MQQLHNVIITVSETEHYNKHNFYFFFFPLAELKNSFAKASNLVNFLQILILIHNGLSSSVWRKYHF